ncbi:MAG: hypothetical protein WB689_33640, partial [Xanthobacteraceae bacterium]
MVRLIAAAYATRRNHWQKRAQKCGTTTPTSRFRIERTTTIAHFEGSDVVLEDPMSSKKQKLS